MSYNVFTRTPRTSAHSYAHVTREAYAVARPPPLSAYVVVPRHPQPSHLILVVAGNLHTAHSVHGLEVVEELLLSCLGRSRRGGIEVVSLCREWEGLGRG